jgi:hypothetical protein
MEGAPTLLRRTPPGKEPVGKGAGVVRLAPPNGWAPDIRLSGFDLDGDVAAEAAVAALMAPFPFLAGPGQPP